MDQGAVILVVDDQPENLLILEDIFVSHYGVRCEPDGEAALAYLRSGGRADLMLLDVKMPGIDGYEVCKRVKSDPRTRDIPVLFLTSLDSHSDEARGLSMGAEDFIHKPVSPPVVLARVRTHLKLARTASLLRGRTEDLEREVAERTREIFRQSEELVRRGEAVGAAQAALVTALCALVDMRDNETGNHILRTQQFVHVLAMRLAKNGRYAGELDPETIEHMFRAAPLHDIGKVAVPDAVLRKPGKLDPHEWVLMRRHAEHGRATIERASVGVGAGARPFLRHARDIAYCHHERWDGSGYPRGIAGLAIPLSARLMAVADVYDALTTTRVYKPAVPHSEAAAMIEAERGRHFDPDVVDAFVDLRETFDGIARQYADKPPRDASVAAETAAA